MDQDDPTARIKAMIAEHFGIDVAKLTPETEIAALGIDSLGIMQFLFDTEDKLQIRLPATRPVLTTVGDVTDAIERAIRARNAAA